MHPLRFFRMVKKTTFIFTLIKLPVFENVIYTLSLLILCIFREIKMLRLLLNDSSFGSPTAVFLRSITLEKNDQVVCLKSVKTLKQGIAILKTGNG
jgi:hypothetical protein